MPVSSRWTCAGEGRAPGSDDGFPPSEGKAGGSVLSSGLGRLHGGVLKPSLLTNPILLGHPPSKWDVKGSLSLSCILVPPTSVLFLPLATPAWFHRLESFSQNVLPKKHHLVDKLIRLRAWAVVLKWTKAPLFSILMGTGARRVPG